MKAQLHNMIQVEQIAGRTPVAIELSMDDEGELFLEESNPATAEDRARAAKVSVDGVRPHVQAFHGLPITYGHEQTRVCCREDSKTRP
jgi:hypothetical protein